MKLVYDSNESMFVLNVYEATDDQLAFEIWNECDVIDIQFETPEDLV